MDNSAKAREDAERFNDAQRINQLPNELLSQIFVTGYEDQLSCLPKYADTNDNEDWNEPDFQDLVVQVCHHWRAVALVTPKLWTHIHIVGAPPHHRAMLFLARSGPTVPLMLKLDLEDNFRSGLDVRSYVDRTVRTLQLIVEHGGSTSRWKWLKVWSEATDVMMTVVNFIANSTMDKLDTLWLFNQDNGPDGTGGSGLVQQNSSKSILFHNPPSSLRNLALIEISFDVFFDNSSIPLVTNLTHLDLATIRTLPPLKSLHALLKRSPGLVFLGLDMSMVDQTHLTMDSIESLPVVAMPHLRRFVLVQPRLAHWALSLLMMIDAPGVETFILDLDYTTRSGQSGSVATFAASGRKNGRLASMQQPTTCFNEAEGPIFPALQHLAVGCFPGNESDLELMLKAYSTITRLRWTPGESNQHPNVFRSIPFICRKLAQLRVRGVPENDVLEVVERCYHRDAPLELVEINSRSWESFDECTISLLRKFAMDVRPYDDIEEDEDEEG